MSEPPLFAGPIQGVRAWRVVADPRTDEPVLAAAAQNIVWMPGEFMRGVCLAPRHIPRMRPHFPPEPDCSCGIYAHHPVGKAGLEWLENVLAADAGRIAGVISAWGNLEVHLDGFRAEIAKPDTFLYRHAETKDVADRLAARYGADVVEIPDERALRAYSRTLNGIPLSQARAHVAATIEIDLAPATSIFPGDGEVVAQSGYRIDEDSCDLQPSIVKRIPGLALFRVAGVSFRSEALQRPEFEPGRPVRLVREPDNPHDRHAVSVWDESGEVQVGYVPRSDARRVAAALRREAVKRAYVVSQFRGMKTGERSGIQVLTSPTDVVRFNGEHCAGEITEAEDIPF